MLACESGKHDLVDKLLSRGAEKECKTINGSLLHFAARAGDIKTIRLLLDSHKIGKDVRAKDGTTPLHECACIGNPEILKEILN